MFEPLVPLTTDTAIVAMAHDLVGTANQRRTWLFLIDDEDRSLPLAIPMEGIPADPDPEDVDRLADAIRHLVAGVEGAERAILVWERPGGPGLRMPEADWIAGLAASGAPIRAQLLSTDDGVRLLDPAFDAIVVGTGA